MENPKLDGSGIVDCIPQTGGCPNNCEGCFYNDGFYLDIDKDLPLWPSAEDANKRIVRVNSGHDSALLSLKDMKSIVDNYEHYFFNTSTPDRFKDKFGSRYPVVVTVNPGNLTDKRFYKLPASPNTMFVRVRVNLWNRQLIRDACAYYTRSKNITPVVLTFMRYKDIKSIPPGYRSHYQEHKHILHRYYSLTLQEEWKETCWFAKRYKAVYFCGNPWSSLCERCGNCLREYFACKERPRNE